MPPLQRTGSRRCVRCGAPADSFCARCGVTPYCSQACQAKDWTDRHRDVCHNLARLNKDNETGPSAVDINPRIQNPAPLRRPHAITDERRGRTNRNDDTATMVTEKSDRQRNQERPYYDSAKRSPSTNQNQYYGQKNRQPFNYKKPANDEPQTPPVESKPEVKPLVQNVVKPEVKIENKVATPAVTVPTTPPVNGTSKQEVATNVTTKPATVGDVTPTKKMIPKSYLIEQISIGDSVAVEVMTSSCRSARGDYVCLSIHDRYETDYQLLCEDYLLDCDAETEQFKPSPGDICSFFNTEDGSWYRARCLTPTTLALIDSSKIVSFSKDDKIRKVPNKYEQIPEFSCVLESKNVEIGNNLKCLILSKSEDGSKVSIEDVDTGSNLGEGFLSRWLPPVVYPANKPVIPEILRPALTNNSRVLLVDATALDRAFVRPSDLQMQREHDDVVQNVILAGRRATPLKEPPVMGQTVIAKFTDGLHYRALCKRTQITQNKYLLEYIEYGNLQVCLNLEDLYPCPPNLTLSAAPTQVSMIKLTAEGGQLTPPAAEYVEKLKDGNEEIVLTLPNGEATAPSGSVASLKLVKNSEMINKKIVEMCTPDWKKFQDKGGDVVEIPPLMYTELEYKELPSGPADLVILDVTALQKGMLSGHLKGDPNPEFVYNHLTEKIAEYCNSELGMKPYLPMAEELCIAQCPPYPQWFRAVLVSQVSGAGGEQAQVLYIDYGNVDFVSVSLLRKMLPEFVRGVPTVVAQLQIKDFPKNPTEDMILRAAEHLKINEEGRGELHIINSFRQEAGLYIVEAPGLLKAMNGTS